MSDIDTLRRAATRMRAEDDPRWHPVGDWLDWCAVYDRFNSRAIATARGFLADADPEPATAPVSAVERSAGLGDAGGQAVLSTDYCQGHLVTSDELERMQEETGGMVGWESATIYHPDGACDE